MWTAIRRWVAPGCGSIAENQHLIVIGPVNSGGAAGEELVAAARASGTFIQVIASGPDPALEGFCGRVGGLFRIADQA